MLTPSLPQLWALVVLAGIFIILNLSLIRPHDFWWHVRTGQWIVEHRRVPTVDLFSYTRLDEPWTNQSWLMEIGFYLLFQAGSLSLVIFLHAVVITAAYGLVLIVNREAARGNLRWAAIATLAAAVVGVSNWNVRPQTISFPLFALTLFLLERHAVRAPEEQVQLVGDRLLWLLPPVFALWANAHGGFVFGLALVGTSLLAELFAWVRRQRAFPLPLALASLLSLGACLITPMGLGMGDYVLGFFRHPITRSLNVEFFPPTVRSLSGQLFFVLAALLIVLLVGSRCRPSGRETIRLLLFGALALLAERNVAWFGIVAAPTLAASLRTLTARRDSNRRPRRVRARLNRAIAALVGLLATFSLPWLRPTLPLPPDRQGYLSAETPVEAVAFLCDLSPTPQPFHTEVYGSYLIWACPEVPVFVDTRIELYPEAQWTDYLAVSFGRYDWETILERYGVDTLLLEKENQAALIEAVMASRDWEQVYEDEQTITFQRGGGS